MDIGGSRSASAIVGVTRELEVAEVRVYQGDRAVLEVTEQVLAIAERRPVIEVAFDPMRFAGEAMRLERDHGLRVVSSISPRPG